MNTASVNDKLRKFVTHHFSKARTKGFTDNDPLLESGIVDSMGVLDLVTFIESEFQITVADEDLVPDHFESIETIALYVESRQKEVTTRT